jgi:hypothetical protein
MDHHLIALFALAGTGLDLIGGLFLAYELLGQRHGLLRSILRAILYSFLVASVYALALDWRFALVAGMGLGLVLTYELGVSQPSEKIEFDLSKKRSHALTRRRLGLACFRGLSLGAGAAWTFSISLGLWFWLLATVALVAAYRLRFAPSDEFEASERPHLSGHKVAGAVVRAILLGLAGTLGARINGAKPETLEFGIRYGLVVGLVGLVLGSLTGFIEWYIDRLSERRLGLLGVCLIICGILLQSIQYWVALRDVPVR